MLKLETQLDYKGRTIERAKANVRLLKNVVHQSQNKIISVSENALNDLIDKQNISKNEKLAIQQILKASKAKDPKSRRYSDDWIILCVLLHMRSPATYRLIRDLGILPVPCERSIRK